MMRVNYYQLMLNLRQGSVGNVRFQLSPTTLADFAHATVVVRGSDLLPGDRFIYAHAVATYLAREVIEVYDPLYGISHEVADRLRDDYVFVLRAGDGWQATDEQRAAVRAVRGAERIDGLHEFDEDLGGVARFNRAMREYVRD